ncbi:MAG: hypothetical protein ACLRIP_12460 [Blautia massiliensis (ex Durand et al. 2017)]
MKQETGVFLLFTQALQNHLRAFYTRSYGRYKTGMGGSSAYLKNEDPQLILPEDCMQQAKELQEANMADDGKRGIILDYLEGKLRCVQEKYGLKHWKKAFLQKVIRHRK